MGHDTSYGTGLSGRRRLDAVSGVVVVILLGVRTCVPLRGI